MQPFMLGIIVAAVLVIAWLLMQRTRTSGAPYADRNDLTVIDTGSRAGETEIVNVDSTRVERIVSLPVERDTVAINDRDMDPLQVHDKEVRP